MPGFATKWPVRVEFTVGPADLEVDGLVSDDAVVRWVDDAVSCYLERCPSLDPARVVRELAFDGARLTGGPSSVSVVASVHEVRPTELVMALRVHGGDDTVRAACLVRLIDPAAGEPIEVSKDLRDELVALERAAAHMG